DDLKWLAANTLNLGLGLLRNIVNLATFAVIVWGLSGVLTLTLAGSSVDIYGYMLWVGLVYAIAGSYAMERIGSRLVAVDYRQQQAEADFRFLLTRVRTQAEQIAFYAGEATERVRLLHRFAAIRANWRLVMTYTKRITMVESLYTEAGAIIPYLLNGPRYFSGAITLGGLMQINS
ncbi:MAG: SbmA/BacA-like family transporter, partial [Pollutimonas bauzanensis]